MQTPICEVCLRSEILCNACQEKFNNGELNEIELEVLRFLYKLSERVKSLKNVNIIKVIDSGVLLIITGRGDAAKIVGRKGSIVKVLAKRFKKNIRVLEEATSFRKFIQDLISPVSLNGINMLYTENKKIYRIRIPTRSHLLLSPESFSEIVEDLFDYKAEIVFEG